MKVTAANTRAAAGAVGEVLKMDKAADRALHAFFRRRRDVGQDDRALVAEVVYAVLRRLRTLEEIARGRREHGLVAAALLGPLGQNAREVARAMDVPPVEAEAMRSTWFALQDRLPGPAAFDLPEWIWRGLAEQHGVPAAAALCRSLLEPAPLDVRVNAARTDRDSMLDVFTREGYRVAPTPFSPHGIRFAGRPALQEHPAFVSGVVEVQDEGSQLMCHLVGPRRGEMVADFCAGAGGKTLALAALMRGTGRIYAFDVAGRRLEKMKPRLARAGVDNVHLQALSSERDARLKRLAQKFDRVLIDAPCSGLGTLRRNPELKWRQQPQDVAELVAKQSGILESACRLVKPGGRLVYVTCSLLREENEAVVDQFCAHHAEYERAEAPALLAEERVVLPSLPGPDLHLYPHIHHTDGFFAAVLRRQAAIPAGRADTDSGHTRAQHSRRRAASRRGVALSPVALT